MALSSAASPRSSTTLLGPSAFPPGAASRPLLLPHSLDISSLSCLFRNKKIYISNEKDKRIIIGTLDKDYLINQEVIINFMDEKNDSILKKSIYHQGYKYIKYLLLSSLVALSQYDIIKSLVLSVAFQSAPKKNRIKNTMNPPE